MIPPDWQREAESLPTREGFEYLVALVQSILQQLDERDGAQVRAFQGRLGISPQQARVALVLYRRRGEGVQHKRLLLALCDNPDNASDNGLKVAMVVIRRAYARAGGSITNLHGYGYRLDCPDLF